MNGAAALLGVHVIGQCVALLEPCKAPIAARAPLASPSQSFTSSCSSEERALHARQRNPAIPPPLPPPQEQNQAGFPPTCNFSLFLSTTATLFAPSSLPLFRTTHYTSPSHATLAAARASAFPGTIGASFIYHGRSNRCPCADMRETCASRTFSFPPRSSFPTAWEASRCMTIRNSTQRAFKKDSCWPPRLPMRLGSQNTTG